MAGCLCFSWRWSLPEARERVRERGRAKNSMSMTFGTVSTRFGAAFVPWRHTEKSYTSCRTRIIPMGFGIHSGACRHMSLLSHLSWLSSALPPISQVVLGISIIVVVILTPSSLKKTCVFNSKHRNPEPKGSQGGPGRWEEPPLALARRELQQPLGRSKGLDSSLTRNAHWST